MTRKEKVRPDEPKKMSEAFKKQLGKLTGKVLGKHRHKEEESEDPKEKQTRIDPVEKYQFMQENIQVKEEKSAALRAHIAKVEEGIRHVELGVTAQDLPTEAEIKAKRRQLNFIEGRLHVAVVGTAGSGKSRFLESISDEVDTEHPHRYKSENILWYELPGVGVDGTSRINYFHEYGVYAFDLIIILTGNRVIDFDLAIAVMADESHIPYIFVRSKSDELIQSIRDDIKERDEQLEGEKLEMRVREEVDLKIKEIVRNLNDNLIRTKLPPLSTNSTDRGAQFFLVNCRTLNPNKRRQVEAEIDEEKLRRFIKRFASSQQAKRRTEA